MVMLLVTSVQKCHNSQMNSLITQTLSQNGGRRIR